MILDFTKEVAEIMKAVDPFEPNNTLQQKVELHISMILAGVYGRGMEFERRRVLDIISRKALNAAELRAEITRPLR
ncbi:hypothetical protein EOA79_02395 [Mesorhizobium sp. M1A.F.Ca.IN.020.03.2.1]|uniref:hypothetical protein n=1 Tax=Mesorhizobium sp. M1A.F.Ca.IN.020.03.2.1 TaxID=2496769 RepID=UPI000FD548DE|nr:hypothetical protein [Mesorhizobium sp. M1A.F.Ca.IN.020.03.2.1]RUV07959.1 hypothetical protein EOA79_02395 [Mesorhizobium sp. M1A.F.Ca.IN.020.03.2.1]